MCGLVGIAGNLLYQDEFTMQRLLLFDYFRGENSTGMAAIRLNNESVLAKVASNPIDLFGMQQFKAALNGNASKAFIGHNRKATRGAVTTVNAHPYHFDHIVGAHNGTLDYKSVNALEEALGEKFGVDSMALIAGIAKLGIKKTIELCYEGKDGVDGAWAITWYDQKEGTLNFLRNKHRSLYYAFEEGFKRMFWASEWWMLREAMEESTNKYKLYTEKIAKDVIGYFVFEADVHYKFDLDKLCAGSTKRPKPVCTPLKGKEPEPAKVYAPFVWPEKPKPPKTETYGTHTTTVGKGTSRQKTTSNILQLTGSANSPYAGIIDEEKFSPMAFGGCAWCCAEVKFGDPGVSIYERDGRVLCRKCNGYPDDHPSPPIKIYVRSSILSALQGD